MVSKRCKICQSEHRVAIETFILQGFSEGYCVNWLQQRGETVTEYQVKNHILKHTQLSVTIEDKPSVTEKTERVNNQIEGLSITIPEIPESLEFEELVAWVQNSIGRIFIKQCVIVEQTQDLYIKGEIKHPTEQIRGLKYLSDVLDLAWGYKPGIDLSRAISVIEAEGYSVIDERSEIDKQIESEIEQDRKAYPEINPPLKSARPSNPSETEEG
jgi:hypothetical protein